MHIDSRQVKPVIVNLPLRFLYDFLNGQMNS